MQADGAGCGPSTCILTTLYAVSGSPTAEDVTRIPMPKWTVTCGKDAGTRRLSISLQVVKKSMRLFANVDDDGISVDVKQPAAIPSASEHLLRRKYLLPLRMHRSAGHRPTEESECSTMRHKEVGILLDTEEKTGRFADGGSERADTRLSAHARPPLDRGRHIQHFCEHAPTVAPTFDL